MDWDFIPERCGRGEKTSRENINIFTFIVSFNFQHPIWVTSVMSHSNIFWKGYWNNVVQRFMEKFKFFESEKTVT